MNRSPQLDDIEYERFRELLLARTGMLFGPRQRDALAHGLTSAAGRTGVQDLAVYYHTLRAAGSDTMLWDDLIGEITVGETYFFRGPAHFDALRERILPDLIARHHQDRRLRIWSAGCSTGEEPYSLALLLHETLPDLARWNVLILATDINRGALQKARQGRFREWSFRQTEDAIRQRYFRAMDGVFELDTRMRDLVTFAYLNLVEDSYPSLPTNTNALDLILFRNVAIYLPEAVIRRVVARFHRSLAPEGWLIVGAAETNQEIYSQFAAHNLPGATVYQKVTRPPVTAVQPVTEPASLPLVQRAEPAFLGELRQEHRREEPEKTATPADLCQEGLACLEQGRYQAAIDCLLACVAREPDLAPPYHHLARAYANRGQLAEAGSWCRQAIERDPLRTEAHYTLALILQEQGTLAEAIAQLKKTLYLDPGFALAHLSLSNLYRQVGRKSEADRHRTQALRLAALMSPDEVVPGSDGLRAARLLTMIRSAIES